MQVQRFTCNAFQENTYVLTAPNGARAVVDPGCYDRAEQNTLRDYLDGPDTRVEHLLNTHAHLDHILGNAFVHRTYGVPLGLHPADEPTLRAAPTFAAAYGFPAYEELLPAYALQAGDVIAVGDARLDVMFAPGHAPGHVVFYCPAAGFCVAGDVLFRESVGRTDLPGGDHDTLMKSIREVMYALPDDTVIYPGHGPTTTIGHEKRHNPFCRLSVV